MNETSGHGGAYVPLGVTHRVPYRLLPLWRRTLCPRGWHALDEVISPGTAEHPHYLSCDACGLAVPLRVGADTATAVACPECPAEVVVPIDVWLANGDDGAQQMFCEPDLTDLWAHAWTHASDDEVHS